MKKFCALLLAFTMVLSMAACGEKKPAPETPDAPSVETPDTPAATDAEGYQDPYADLEDYDEKSEAIYNDNLGEFLEHYQAALEEKTDADMRYALMAVADAKMLESCVMLPMNTRGGNFGIRRVAPRSRSTVMWGPDQDRVHSTIVVEELLKVEDIDALKALWAETAGTGTWQESAKAYLTEHGYTLKDTLTELYATEIKNWDILATSHQTDADILVQTIDSLVEYDSENVLQPALAESWEVSEDMMTYTFKIREGVKWVDAQGREVADLTADDFVAGFQHMLDAGAGLEFLIDNKIVNVHEYITGDITDFSEVGVKALDDYTLEMTLTEPVSYFLTMLPYGCFAPMNRTFYESKGGKFGEEFDASAADYKYGKGPDSIAYCGPFVVTNYTPENIVAYKANESYWNPDAVNIKSYTQMFYDGKDPLKPYTDTKNGVLDGCGLTSAPLEAAKKDGLFEDYATISGTNGISYMGFFNLNREAYENFNDGAAKSEKDEDAKIRATAALRNVHFRRALSFAIDRANRNAQAVGEEVKLPSLRNSYIPGTFVQLSKDVTIAINGTDTTFPAGTYYGEMVQAVLDADGEPMKVWDPTADGGIGSSDGFDGWYNPEAAKAEMELAIAELAEQGVEISAENPIYIDSPYAAPVEYMKNQANALKQGVEAVLEGNVVINLVGCTSTDEYSYTGFLTSTGSETNYDFSDGFGWGPDYGDPSSYLDTMLPDYAGAMVRSFGLF